MFDDGDGIRVKHALSAVAINLKKFIPNLHTHTHTHTGNGHISYLLVWPHEVEPWFHSWYRGRVETLDAKYNLVTLLVWPHEAEPWFHSWYRGSVEILNALWLHQQFKERLQGITLFSEANQVIYLKNHLLLLIFHPSQLPLHQQCVEHKVESRILLLHE